MTFIFASLKTPLWALKYIKNAPVWGALLAQLSKAQLWRPQPFRSGFDHDRRNEFFQAALQSSSEFLGDCEVLNAESCASDDPDQ